MNTWNNIFWTVAVLFLIAFASCREDFEFSPTTGTLEFSKDTVFLDTVFTNIGSSTYTLKVYNRSDTDIRIPQVGLRRGTESSYRLNVDGVAGNSFENVPLLARDSLFVFIETTFDVGPTGENEFLNTDGILFGETGNYQEVALVTLVRDAIFLYPRTESDGSRETLLLGLDEAGNEIRIEGFVLEDNELQFTREKPYVIYGYAAVAEGSTLSMEAGTRVHFHQDSGILVGNGGSLQIQGSLSADREVLENEVIFEGDRLEPDFSDTPGQWGTIWLSPGSIGNAVEYLTIKNATVGLLVDGDGLLETPTLTLSNTQIHNSSNRNLWARNAKVEALNTIFGNAGAVSLHCNLGGDYVFKHCTIANYWRFGFRNSPTLLIDDAMALPSGQLMTQDLDGASFSNCIIDGNRDVELLFSNQGEGSFNYQFVNCSIRFRDARGDFANNPLYDFENQTLFQNVFLNPSTSFLDVTENNFNLTPDSEILDLGNLETALEIPLDILGNDRTMAPDLGAFELNQ
ncbi:hypothetical protein FGF1_44160 [Flavobacteriaceae bacterium GF1]